MKVGGKSCGRHRPPGRGDRVHSCLALLPTSSVKGRLCPQGSHERESPSRLETFSVRSFCARGVFVHECRQKESKADLAMKPHDISGCNDAFAIRGAFPLLPLSE